MRSQSTLPAALGAWSILITSSCSDDLAATDASSVTSSSSTSSSSSSTGEPEPPAGVTECTLSDPLPWSDWWVNDTVIRLSPEGDALYVATDKAEIRRYWIGEGPDCELTFDNEFGMLGVGATDLGVDLGDQLFIVNKSTSVGVKRVWPDPTITCQPTEWMRYLGIDASGGHKVTSSYDEEFFRFSTLGPNCDYTKIQGMILPDGDPTIQGVFVDSSGQIHVGVYGDLNPDTLPPEYAIARYAPDGTGLGLYGNLEKTSAPDGFCTIRDITNCGGDVCIHDFNCVAIKRFSNSGVFISERETKDLRWDLDFFETSITGRAEIEQLYVAGTYDAGGRSIFRIDL